MARKKLQGLVGCMMPKPKDGHTRITKSEDYVVVGGSKESHERGHQITAKVTEEVKKRGGKVRSPEELAEIVDKVSR